MQATTTNSTQEPLTCAGCGHPIQEGQTRLSDVPENMPEGVELEAFRHFHLNCLQCPANATCYQRYASRQTAFAAQIKTECAGCGHSIAQGQNVFRDYHFVWNLGADSGDTGEVSGGVAGMRPPANGAVSFSDLPNWLKRKFQVAGLSNGRGSRTLAEAEELFQQSVPRGIRNIGVKAIEKFLKGKDASHIESVANAPGKAKMLGNIKWEPHNRNLKRGSLSMNSGDKLRVHASNGADTARILGKNALGTAGRASLFGMLAELPLSLAEGAIRVAKGKRSKEEAARETAVNTAKAGAVAGVMAVALTGVVALGAGPALSAFSRVVVPLGVAMYGWSAFRRIKGVLEDPDPLARKALYFHADCEECGGNHNCYEAFAEEMSAYSEDGS